MRPLFTCLLLSCLGLAGCADEDDGGAGQGCQMRTVAEMRVLNDHGSPLVRATINGTPVAFMVDTGASRTFLFDAAVMKLGLPVDRNAERLESGIGGRVFGNVVTVDALSLGTAAARHMEFDSIPSFALTAPDGTPVVGLFGGDFLANYDVEFDLPDHLITLFDEHHCSGNLKPWSDVNFYRQPFELQGQTAIEFDASINDNKEMVVLDSGAARTVIDDQAGRDNGATRTTTAHDEPFTAVGIDSNRVPAHRHRFDSLDIGPEHFAPAWLDVADMDVEGLLGADFFRARKVWISYPHEVLYVQRGLFPHAIAPATGGSPFAESVPSR